MGKKLEKLIYTVFKKKHVTTSSAITWPRIVHLQ